MMVLWWTTDIYLYVLVFTLFIFIISWLWVKPVVAKVQPPSKVGCAIRTKHSNALSFSSSTLTSLVLYLYAFSVMFAAAVYWYNWELESIIAQIAIYNKYWFYFFSLITISGLIWSVYKERVVHHRSNAEAASITILLMLTFLSYLSFDNLFILTFLLECQGILFVYFISQTQNTFKFSKLFKSVMSIFNQSKIWYSNALFTQFWTNFFGAIFLILCVSQLVNLFGVTSWMELSVFVPSSNFIAAFKKSKLAWLFMVLLIGFILKIGLIPFHFWKPELYRNLSYVNMFFYATIYVFAFVFLFVSITDKNYYSINFVSTKIIWFLVIVSLYVITCFLFFISEIKIFLAYTSVAHLTYIFSAMLIAYPFYDKMLFYIYLYVIVTVAVFLVLLSLKNLTLNYLSDLQIIASVPYLLFQLIIATAAMAGLPPFLGFWAKIFIVLGLWCTSEYILSAHVLSCGLILMYFYFQNYRFSLVINTKTKSNAIQLVVSYVISKASMLVLLLNFNGFLLVDDFLSWSIISFA